MHDFMPHVDGSAETLDGLLDDADGPLYAGAEAARGRQINLHRCYPFSLPEAGAVPYPPRGSFLFPPAAPGDCLRVESSKYPPPRPPVGPNPVPGASPGQDPAQASVRSGSGTGAEKGRLPIRRGSSTTAPSPGRMHPFRQGFLALEMRTEMDAATRQQGFPQIMAAFGHEAAAHEGGMAVREQVPDPAQGIHQEVSGSRIAAVEPEIQGARAGPGTYPPPVACAGKRSGECAASVRAVPAAAGAVRRYAGRGRRSGSGGPQAGWRAESARRKKNGRP